MDPTQIDAGPDGSESVKRAPRRRSRLASGSLTCGILAAVFLALAVIPILAAGLRGARAASLIALPSPVLAVVAIILGLAAWLRFRKQPSAGGVLMISAIGVLLGTVILVGEGIMFSTSLARAREHAARAKEARLLKQIHAVCMHYSMEHEDRLPPNLQTLVDEGLLPADLLQSPADADKTNECDYYYVAYEKPFVHFLSANETADFILAFSDKTHHGGNGGNVLYLLGTLDFLTEPAFTETMDNFKRRFQEKYGMQPTVVEPR